MGKNTLVVGYKQNSILDLMRAILKSQDTSVFYDFVNNYGVSKICDIVNSNEYQSSLLNNDIDNIDIISKRIFNNISNVQYNNAILNSPYYYVKYTLNPSTNVMVEQNISLLYDVLINNKKVDVKKRFSVDDIKRYIESKDIVLLGIKEKEIAVDSYFFGDLQEVDKNFVAEVDDGFIKKSIFPSIKFADSETIIQNLQKFENDFENLSKEMQKANKKILHSVLKYEVQIQQIYLSGVLADGQKQFVQLVNEYQTKASKIEKMIDFNQKILETLGEKPKAKDYKFDNDLKK